MYDGTQIMTRVVDFVINGCRHHSRWVAWVRGTEEHEYITMLNGVARTTRIPADITVGEVAKTYNRIFNERCTSARQLALACKANVQAVKDKFTITIPRTSYEDGVNVSLDVTTSTPVLTLLEQLDMKRAELLWYKLKKE
jgi:hypothetical protein